MPDVAGPPAPLPGPSERAAPTGEQTAPHPPPTSDTSPGLPSNRDPLEPLAADPEPSTATPATSPAPPETEEPGVTDEPASGPVAVPAQSVAVPGSYQYVKRWTFVLVLAGTWLAAAAVGLGLYYWWYHSIEKTPPVFVVLMYLVVCTVGGLLIAMVQNKPLVSATAIALMSAPFASTGAAAALYGVYYCERVSRCLVGVIPY